MYLEALFLFKLLTKNLIFIKLFHNIRENFLQMIKDNKSTGLHNFIICRLNPPFYRNRVK